MEKYKYQKLLQNLKTYEAQKAVLTSLVFKLCPPILFKLIKSQRWSTNDFLVWDNFWRMALTFRIVASCKPSKWLQKAMHYVSCTSKVSVVTSPDNTDDHLKSSIIYRMFKHQHPRGPTTSKAHPRFISLHICSNWNNNLVKSLHKILKQKKLKFPSSKKSENPICSQKTTTESIFHFWVFPPNIAKQPPLLKPTSAPQIQKKIQNGKAEKHRAVNLVLRTAVVVSSLHFLWKIHIYILYSNLVCFLIFRPW